MLRSRLGFVSGLALLAVLPACDVTMGPPPESDPPLVQQSQEPLPPPAQPTEPQAWSRDLDFDDGGEQRVRRGDLANDLVGAEEARAYSGEQLTFRSAESAERPPTQAELIRQRARERMEAARAGSAASPAVAPPEVVAAPVEQVSAETLPETSLGPETSSGPEPSSAPERSSAPEPSSGSANRQVTEAAPVGPDAAETGAPQGATAPEGAAQTAALPDPQQQPAARPPSEPAPTAAETPAAESPAAETPAAETPAAQAPAVEAWDAPEGTILVQVSAIQDRQEIAGEWDRLKRGYPGVLGPLRLVVEEAKLGDRGVFFRVQAGGFESQADAEAACVALTDQGQPCFVVEKSSDG